MPGIAEEFDAGVAAMRAEALRICDEYREGILASKLVSQTGKDFIALAAEQLSRHIERAQISGENNER
jgi:hypothetical protein